MLKSKTPTYTFLPHRGRNGQTYWLCVHRNTKSVAIAGEGYRRAAIARRSLTRLLAAIEAGDYQVLPFAAPRRRKRA